MKDAYYAGISFTRRIQAAAHFMDRAGLVVGDLDPMKTSSSEVSEAAEALERIQGLVYAMESAIMALTGGASADQPKGRSHPVPEDEQ